MKIKTKDLLLSNCLVILSILISAVLLSGCTQQPIKPGENTVLMENLAFKPNSLTIANGTVVTWINKDGVSHNVMADNNMFSSGTLLNGQNFTFTFTIPGTYNYSCSIHPNMRGKIIVQ